MTAQTDRSAIAVIDIGKTNAKLVVWDHECKTILFETSKPNQSIDAHPYRHLDTEGLWQFYISALRQAVQDIAPVKIGKLIPTTHGATVAILRDDQLALPIPDYENTYDASINHAYDAARDAFSDSQSPRLPAGLNFGRQIFALEENFSSAMRYATDFLPYPQYWAWLFSGIEANEVTSLGCHSDVWRPNQQDWSNLAKSRGWDKKFPIMRKAHDVLGAVLPDVAAQTGLPADCKIYCGIHDSNASLVPLIKAVKPPFTLISSGTWTICFSVGSTAKPELQENRDTLSNVDFNGQAVPSARFMGGREYAHLSQGGTETPDDKAVDYILNNECFAIPPFTESGGPFVGNEGIIINEHVLSTPGHRNALATLYVTLMADYCLEMIESEGPIVIEGPFAKNDALCGLLASLRLSQPVFTSTDTAGTSFGAAILTLGATSASSRALQSVEPMKHDGLHNYRKKWRKFAGMTN